MVLGVMESVQVSCGLYRGCLDNWTVGFMHFAKCCFEFLFFMVRCVLKENEYD